MMTCVSTGLLSTTPTVIATRPCRIHAITLVQAAAASTAIIYDNASAGSGVEITEVNNVTNNSTVTQVFNVPVECLRGATLVLTGAGAKALIHYSLL